MSARNSREHPQGQDELRTAFWFKSVTGPKDPVSIARALAAFGSTVPLDFAEVLTSRHESGKGKFRESFSADIMCSNAADSSVYRMTMHGKQGRSEASFYLRPYEPDVYDMRGCHLYVIASSRMRGFDQNILEFFSAVVRDFSVSQGFMSSFASREHAMSELQVSLVQQDIETALQRRQSGDFEAMDLFGSKLRRLYPVTFIGKAIWDSLPPMPTVDPAPIVRDVGDCKMLITWPELCSPYDPAFLAGTRELREWLWPYTIQNPFDKQGLNV